MKKTVIVDYGVCNVGSVKNMLHHMGQVCEISDNVSVIEGSDYIVLPGVGNYRYAMEQLKSRGIDGILRKKVIQESTPILGICLGMQMLLDHSEEGDCDGLGFVRGVVKRFSGFDDMPKDYKIPHMGWNSLIPNYQKSIMHGITNMDRFYFVHSYAAKCLDSDDSAARTFYGVSFDSVIQKNNVMGVQFHPEKSLKYGMKIFRNFLDYGI